MKKSEEEIVTELKADALKYKTRKEWCRKSTNKYAAATRRRIVDMCCEHMIPVHTSHTVENIKEDALKYKYRGEWSSASSNKYAAARNKGILEECCAHMIPVMNFYSNEEIKADALKYTSRTEWVENSRKIYFAAQRRKILNECCEHMKYVENCYIDDIGIIYAYKFNDGSIYIGLTIKPGERHHQHLTLSGPVFNKIKEGFTYEYVILENKIPNADLSNREVFYIAEYRKDGLFKVLNKDKGGGRGTRRRVSKKPSAPPELIVS